MVPEWLPHAVDQALAPALLHAVRSPLSCWSANICCICAISVAFTINIHLPFIPLPKLDAGWRGFTWEQHFKFITINSNALWHRERAKNDPIPALKTLGTQRLVHTLNKTSLNQVAKHPIYPISWKNVAYIRWKLKEQSHCVSFNLIFVMVCQINYFI